MQKEAGPTQHNYSATTAALAVTGDRAKKATEGQSCTNASLSSYNKVFNRLSELQKSKFSDRNKEHLCCIKGCNNFLSTISVRVNEDILSLR